MLKSLHIRNFVLIDRLDITFDQGFSVITGETGAGKSIILGALALVLGGRADAKSARAGADKCVIEAEFDISAYGLETFFQENDLEYDPTSCLLRRELSASLARSLTIRPFRWPRSRSWVGISLIFTPSTRTYSWPTRVFSSTWST